MLVETNVSTCELIFLSEKQGHRLKGNKDLSFKINLKEGTGPWKIEFEWKKCEKQEKQLISWNLEKETKLEVSLQLETTIRMLTIDLPWYF